MGGGGQKNREKCGRRLWTTPFIIMLNIADLNHLSDYNLPDFLNFQAMLMLSRLQDQEI